jgi:iron only hydrogenase large subunit-like protein
MINLTPVIEVIASKCVNCHACIDVCPAKYCNTATGDHVEVNADLCIGCGSCIAACTHDARRGVDDFPAWLEAAGRKEPSVAISAPAIASSFPNDYLHLHGWLQSKGVEAFFDVSFGAELTVKSYLEAVAELKPAALIAQPCPAIVSYIEIYQPELLQYLAPADSPMLHTIKMIREFYPQYKKHRILVLSPCYAKKREFDATGVRAYNVTYRSLADHITDAGIDLGSFPEVEFRNPAAERGVLFSSPGGLMRTVERELPDLARGTRKIEGPGIIYDYLKELPEMIERGFAPPLIDCLNCERGCNGGPGTLNGEKALDEIEYHIEERSRKATEAYLKKGRGKPAASRKAISRILERYWRAGMYSREYVDRGALNTLRIPGNTELEALYMQMHKFQPEDFLNCGSCGFENCKNMAIAIHNGLNKPANCFHYERSSRKEMIELLIGRLEESTEHLTGALHRLTGSEGEKESGEDIVSMTEIADLTRQIKEHVRSGVGFLSQSLDQMKEIEQSSTVTLQGIKTLVEQIGSIWEIVAIISTITDQTKIIAFNAELEAASAGETGRSFEIVAGEIRRLANNTVDSTGKIRSKIEEIQATADTLIRSSGKEGDTIRSGAGLAEKVGVLFTEVLDFSESSEKTIQRSTEAQVGSFRRTLEELKKVSLEIGKFS